MNNRMKAREYAYKLIFSNIFTGDRDEVLFDEIKADSDMNDEDIKYINLTYDNVINNQDDIKGYISKYSIGYDISRVYKPDLAVLMLAIGEMKYNDEIPLGVAINEAVTISKKYSTTKSGSFVNGLLASVYKELNV